MQQEKIKLKNKLETLFIDAPGSNCACVQMWFRAGSALEKKGDQGIAHFLEHMFFKGSQNISGKKLAKNIEILGGELNAFTSFDYTCYYANIPNQEIIQGIKTILEMVSKPLFHKKHIPSERNVVLEELKKTIDNPHQYSFCEIQKSFFQNGYDHPILGFDNTISQFSRKQLISFRKRFYNLSNALLIIAGDLKNKEVIKRTIEKYQIPFGPATCFSKFILRKNAPISIHSKDVKMSQLNLIIQGPDFLDNTAAFEDLAFTCLGHGESSRLYTELVLDTSLANNCSSSTMFLSKGSFHNIKIIFPQENLQKILKKLEDIIKELLKNGFSNKEINRIKNQYASSKIFDKESLESYTFSLGHSFAQTGSIDSEQDFLDKIKKTTPEKVNYFINQILSREINIQLQTPEKINHQTSYKYLEVFKNNIFNLSNHIKSKKIKDGNIVSQFDPQVQLLELKPGINLLYRQNLITPTYVFHAYLKGGLIDETKTTNGIYNLLTQNLYKGYDRKPYSEIKHSLENNSSTLQGFSGKNAYGLTLHGLTEHFKESFDIFMGSFLRPDFPTDSIKHEKEMILRYLDSQKKDPVKQCFQNVSNCIFNNHPYSFNSYGSHEIIKLLSRKQLIETHSWKINHEKILFTYCGDLDLDLITEQISSHLTHLNARKGLTYQPQKYSSKKETLIQIPFEREQTQIFLGIPIKGINSGDSIAFNILTTFLSGQGSLLFERIREKQGLSYVVQPVHFSALDGGYFGIYMACTSENVKKSLHTLNHIFDELRDKGISQSAFSETKKMIKGQNLINIQTNEDYANIYSIPFIFGLGLDHFHSKNKVIESLSYSHFQNTIKKIFRNKRYTVLVGNQD